MLVAVREVATTFVGGVGAWVSGQAGVEPVTDAREEALPAASTAATSKVYVVPQVSDETVVPVWVTVDFSVPSTYTRYPVTPTLSVEALQASEMLDAVEPTIPRPPGWEGAVRSEGWVGHELVGTVTCACCEALPAASRAVTPNTYDVPHERPVRAALVAPTVATFVVLRYTS